MLVIKIEKKSRASVYSLQLHQPHHCTPPSGASSSYIPLLSCLNFTFCYTSRISFLAPGTFVPHHEIQAAARPGAGELESWEDMGIGAGEQSMRSGSPGLLASFCISLSCDRLVVPVVVLFSPPFLARPARGEVACCCFAALLLCLPQRTMPSPLLAALCSHPAAPVP
jgi:hypothetical protein